MIPVNAAFKEAMKRPVKELDAYIRIDANNSITSADDLISIKISCDSGMCKAAMRKLEAKYTGEHNLLGQWVHVGFGVKLPSTGTFDYLDYGSFLITEIKTSKDTDVTEIVAYDKMVNAMTKYEELQTTYPQGLFAYTQLLCQACNLTLGNENFTTNNNWQVTEELWKNISGVTYRDIFQQIAQVTGTTCIISNDDKIYFKTINATGETLTYDNLFKLKLEPIYGEINSVVLSREPITGEDVYMKDDASILANGLTEFKIDNNQIVDKRRDAAITPIYNALHGISFYPFEAHTEGLGWYEIGDSFDIINDTNDTFNTTLFNYSIVVDGGIKETLKTNAETKTQSQYEYATKTSKRLANAEVAVNKQQNEITALVEATDEIQKEINPIDNTTGSSIYLEDSAEAELQKFELEGKTTQANTPSPDNPSELVSVGYENLLNVNILETTSNGTTKSVNENKEFIIDGSGTGAGNFNVTTQSMAYKAGKDYVGVVKVKSGSFTPYVSTSKWAVQMYFASNKSVSIDNDKTEFRVDFTFDSDTTFTPRLWFGWNNSTSVVGTNSVFDNLVLQISVFEGTEAHNYIPYGKYGIEVKTTGKNIFGVGERSDYTGSGLGTLVIENNTMQATITSGAGTHAIKDDKFYGNSFYASADYNYAEQYSVSLLIRPYDSSDNLITNVTISGWSYNSYYNAYVSYTNNSFKLATASYIKFGVAYRGSAGQTGIYSNIMLVKGEQAVNYEPYQGNTYLYTLDNPLRSIGDTKDLLYIRNGMLYVDRKIGSIVLNGSENWGIVTRSDGTTKFFSYSTSTIYTNTASLTNELSNYFVLNNPYTYTSDSFWLFKSGNNNIFRIGFADQTINTVALFKTWLSTHNTEVQYILAEPYTEEVGQAQIPSTYEGITYINTTDANEPTINITYVRDTVIANYVESHVSELKINEQGIESRVQTIEESDYGGQILSVEERTTSTEKNIEVISTNIDTTTGEVRKVTTTNGMTFDENGLNIHTNQSTFNAQHTYEGTYYRDGEEVITETTINGFKATNLKNKGQHEYSYDDTHDLYEFIDERIEVDGEYCYATFYNGEE